MSTQNKFILNPRLKSWVILIVAFLFFFPKQSPAQDEHPNWIAYDIGNVWSVNALASEKDTLWIATNSWGLIKLNKITHEYQSYDLTDYGFKRNWAESIVVDKSGNKWFRSMEGIVKFDGTNFTLYDSLGNSDNNFYEIKLDNNQNIWVNTGKKLAIFDGKNWQIFDKNDSNSIYYRTGIIAFDSAGHLWASIVDKEFHYRIIEIYDGKRVLFKSDSLTNYIYNYSSWKSWGIESIEVSKNDIKWVTVQDAFSGWCLLFKIENDSTWSVTEGFVDDYDFLPSTFRIAIESDNNIWIYGWEYLRWYDGEESWRYYTFKNGFRDDCTNPIIFDNNGNKWFAVSDCYQSNDEHPCYIVALREGGVKLGVDEPPQVSHPDLYPNPAGDYIYINSPLIEGVGGGWQYQIYDILGNCVQSGMIESNKINISQLSSGFYTVRFFNGGKQVVEKMMKE